MTVTVRVGCDACSEGYVSVGDIGVIVNGELRLGVAQLALVDIPPSWNIVDGKRLLCGYCDAFRRKLGPVTIAEANKPKRRRVRK